MTNQPRTDIHRPTDLVTEDYDYVGAYYNGSASGPGDLSDRAIALRKLVAQSTTTRYHSGTQCDHCGAHIVYVAVVKHLPTGDHLAIGETCLDNRFARATRDFQAMRAAAKLDRQAHAIRSAWDAYRSANPADWDALEASTNGFVVDVLRKGRRYGNLSDRQFSAIIRAVARDAEFEARKVEAAKVAPATTTVPLGNAVLEGTIVSTKWVEGYMPGSSVEKMLVKVSTDAGEFRVFGTIPASIHGAGKGDVIRFTASCSASENDTAFGFFSRPRNATILVAAPQEVTA
jgi:hypothetical protein